MIKSRLNSAPARPLTDIEIFKQSEVYFQLEKIVISTIKYFNNCLQINNMKIIEILENISALITAFNIPCSDKSYRKNFLLSYRILYERYQYLPDILEFALEECPNIYINQQKYEFSDITIKLGAEVLSKFQELLFIIRKTYLICNQHYNKQGIINTIDMLRQSLIDFDEIWSHFEEVFNFYQKLMQENHQRLLQILNILCLNLNQRYFQQKKAKFNQQILFQNKNYKKKQKHFCEILQYISSIILPNQTPQKFQYKVLKQANKILIQQQQNQQIQKLAQSLIQSVKQMRQVFRDMSKILYQIDPNLSQNQELIECLTNLSQIWQMAQLYLFEKQNLLIQLIQIIQEYSQQNEDFNQKIQNRDSEIFILIPQLIVYQSLKNKNYDLCEFLYPEFQNMIQNIQIDEIDIQSLFNNENNQDLNIIKNIGYKIQRNNPNQYNQLLELALQ